MALHRSWTPTEGSDASLTLLEVMAGQSEWAKVIVTNTPQEYIQMLPGKFRGSGHVVPFLRTCAKISKLQSHHMQVNGHRTVTFVLMIATNLSSQIYQGIWCKHAFSLSTKHLCS